MPRNVVLLVLDTVRKDYFDDFATLLRGEADVSFDQCRAASSWSTPSHASIMTGELPSEHGIHAHNVDFSGLERADTFLADLPEYTACGVSTNIFAGTPFGFEGAFDSFSSMSRHALFPEGLEIDRFLRHTNRDSARRYLEYLRAVAAHDYPLRSLLNGGFLKLNDALEPLPASRLHDFGTGTVCRQVLDELERDEPTFVFANFMEAHTPLQPTRPYDGSLYDVSPNWSSNEKDIFDINNGDDIQKYDKYLEKFRSLYGASIDYLDRRIIELVRNIRTQIDGETTIVVTSDHGENLGTAADGNLLGHVSTLTDGTLHVPLEIIDAPDCFTNSAVSEHVSHLELGDLLVAFGREEPADITRETVPAERIGLGLSHDPANYEHWDRMIRCAYREETKFEWDSLGNRYEYRIDRDRPSWEHREADHVEIPEWALELFPTEMDAYKCRAQSSDDESDMDEHTRSQLENLGYL